MGSIAPRSAWLFVPFLLPTFGLASFVSCAPVEVESVHSDEPSRSSGASIPIVFSADSAVFPAAWREAPFLAVATEVEPEDRDVAIRAIRRALAKYPEPLLVEHLSRVVVVRELRFSSIRAAGTNSIDTVYVACDGDSQDFVEETVHHELSSILLRNFEARFAAHAWARLNAQDFVYGESGVEAILRHADSLEYDDEWNERGFLHEYAAATLEDDFNSIVEKLFMNDARLFEIGARFPVIAEKIRLTEEFYRAIDPGFTPEWFRSLPPSTRDVLRAFGEAKVGQTSGSAIREPLREE